MRPGVSLFHIYFKQNTNETHGIIIKNGLHHPSWANRLSGLVTKWAVAKLYWLSAGTV